MWILTAGLCATGLRQLMSNFDDECSQVRNPCIYAAATIKCTMLLENNRETSLVDNSLQFIIIKLPELFEPLHM